MPKLNHIYSFVAVGFVLVFLGKISKLDLYTAYFKTIADVEIRNTQGVESKALPLEVVEADQAPLVEAPSGPSPVILADVPTYSLPTPTLALSLSLVQDLPHIEQGRFLTGCPTRGPDFS